MMKKEKKNVYPQKKVGKKKEVGLSGRCKSTSSCLSEKLSAQI